MAEPAPSVAVKPGIAGAAVALLVVDDDCVVEEASLAACRLLGLGRDEALKRRLPELLAPAAAKRLHAVWAPFHETGGHAGPFELAWPHGEGAVDISITAAVLPGRHLVVLSPSQQPEPDVPVAATSEDRAVRGARGPTARERQILSMLGGGDTDVQIAEKLKLSPATVQTHVRNAKAKMGARTRAQAVAMAIRGGLITE
jgi:DNA-binding CsgD family transcriptional regulator